VATALFELRILWGCVDVGLMESGSELTTSNGSPMATSNLYITLNADVVCLKYNLAEDVQLLTVDIIRQER
jgi:hypothetical protein